MTGLVLASGSVTRRGLLEAAGLRPVGETAAVDETRALIALRADGADAGAAACTLARLKAEPVALRHPGSLVIGADQILEHRGLWLEKPGDRAAARAQLAGLRGDEHRLVSGVVVMQGRAELWRHADTATLRMRAFDDRYLERYLDAAGDAVLSSVGAYHLEGLGAQLFEAVRGDFFTVLGLPLLPLLGFLRSQGLETP